MHGKECVSSRQEGRGSPLGPHIFRDCGMIEDALIEEGNTEVISFAGIRSSLPILPILLNGG